jgi:signal transduction histidine kinase
MSGMRPVRRLRFLRSSGLGGAVRVAQVVGLAALLWASASEHHSDGSPRVPVALLAVTAVAWAAWLATTRASEPVPVIWLALAVLAGAGGAIGGLAPVGIAFPAVAVIAAATRVGARLTAAIALIGAGSLTITVLAAGSPHAIIAEGLLAMAAALLGGASRRQYHDRAAQAEQVLAERIRADAERDRASALVERNRIGREVHDVLAHSLGALSVQLDAADAVLESGGDTVRARELVQQARRLVVGGLAETRKAVHALREDPVALGEQLAALAATDGAQLTLVGADRRLTPDVEHALYRAAQEALTNARKHAPGAPVTLRLDYGPRATVLVVANGPCPGTRDASPLSQTGAGLGLRGMRERIESLGGDVCAEPHERGWTVRASVPT